MCLQVFSHSYRGGVNGEAKICGFLVLNGIML